MFIVDNKYSLENLYLINYLSIFSLYKLRLLIMNDAKSLKRKHKELNKLRLLGF